MEAMPRCLAVVANVVAPLTIRDEWFFCGSHVDRATAFEMANMAFGYPAETYQYESPYGAFDGIDIIYPNAKKGIALSAVEAELAGVPMEPPQDLATSSRHAVSAWANSVRGSKTQEIHSLRDEVSRVASVADAKARKQASLVLFCTPLLLFSSHAPPYLML